MLSRKTLGVAGAAMLGAVAFLGTNSANAVINLEDGMGKVKYAKETLTTAGEIMRDGVKYYTVTNGSNVLDMSGKLGFDSGSTELFVRFDLTNMVFATTAPGDGGLTGATTSRVAGGTVSGTQNDSWIVYRVTDPTETDEVVTLAPTALGVMLDQPGSAKISVYLSVTDALRGDGSHFRMAEVSNAVSVVSGVKVTVTKGTDVAEVAENFEKFVMPRPGSTVIANVGKVGTIMISPDGDTRSAANSAAVDAAATVYADTGTTITVMGDFSDAVGQHYASGDGCATAANADDSDDLNSTEGMVMLALDTAVAAGGASICLEETADKQIPTAPYMVTAKFAKAADANAFAAPEFMGELGRFTRNGTTVHIPYMTTYDGYNQRLVLSNRGTTNAAYEIMFRPEDGVMASPKDMAMGTLMAGSTMTMKATDLVMLEGGSRTAATINLVAEPGNIDVTSVIVNKMSKDTDTVVHHSGM